MLAALRVLGLTAAVMLAAPATGTAQSSGFMKVPQEVWTNISRFVFLVALDVNAAPGQPEYRRRQAAVPSWPEVYAEAKQWPTLTLPYLQMLARYIVEDENLVDQRLADMVKGADALAPGEVEKLSQYDQTHTRERFDQIAWFLEGRMDLYLGTALAIQAKLQDLVRVSGAILRAQTQDLALMDIQVKAGEAKSALDASMAAWRGLKSDITELRRVVTAAKKADADLYTRVAQMRWADVARDARGLLTDLKAQQKYLDGTAR